MANTKTILLTTGAALLTGVFAYLIVRKKQNQAEYDNVSTLISNIGVTGTAGQSLQKVDANTLPDSPPPYKFGDSAQNIALLQKAINKKYSVNLAITGTYDDSTAKELCKHYWTFCYSWYSDNFIDNYSQIQQTDIDKILA